MLVERKITRGVSMSSISKSKVDIFFRSLAKINNDFVVAHVTNNTTPTKSTKLINLYLSNVNK